MNPYHDDILPAAPGLGPFFISPYALPLARLLIGLEAHTVHARALADDTMDDLYRGIGPRAHPREALTMPKTTAADPCAITQEATPAACAAPPPPATSPSSEPPAAGPALDTRRRPMTPLVRALAVVVIAAGCVLALALTLFLLALLLVFLPVLLVVVVAGLVPVLAWRFWRQVARGGVVRETRTVIGRTMEPPHRATQGGRDHD